MQTVYRTRFACTCSRFVSLMIASALVLVGLVCCCLE